MLTLRKAGWQDCADLYEWRNDAGTRAMSLTGGEVDRDGHERWFAAALADPARCLLVGEDDGKVGVVRFDRRDGRALVSVNLSPARRGQGLAALLLVGAERAARAFLAEGRVRVLVAEIKPENAPSRRAFERAGYRPVGARAGEVELFEKPLDGP